MKKTILATMVAGLISANAFAATTVNFAGVDKNVGLEYLGSSTKASNIDLGDLTYTNTVDTSNDLDYTNLTRLKISLTNSNAVFDSINTALTMIVVDKDLNQNSYEIPLSSTDVAFETDTNGDPTAIILDLNALMVDNSGADDVGGGDSTPASIDALSELVTSLHTDGSNGTIIKIGGLKLKVSNPTNGTVISAKMDLLPATGSTTINSETATEKTSVLEQISIASGTDKATENIDVSNSRLTWEDDDSDVNVSFTLDVASNSITAGANALATGDLNTATITFNGDFSAFDYDGDGKFETGEGIAEFADFDSTSTTSKIVIKDTLTADSSTNAYTLSFSSNPDAENPITLSPTSITADVTFTYDDINDDTQTFSKTGIDLGSWGLNGSTTTIPMMPFDDKNSPFVTISNMSSQAGEVEVTWIDGTVDKLDAVATAGEVTNITTEIKQLAKDHGYWDTKQAFQVTVSAPKNGIEVFALYYNKSSGDRMRVNSSSTTELFESIASNTTAIENNATDLDDVELKTTDISYDASTGTSFTKDVVVGTGYNATGSTTGGITLGADGVVSASGDIISNDTIKSQGGVITEQVQLGFNKGFTDSTTNKETITLRLGSNVGDVGNGAKLAIEDEGNTVGACIDLSDGSIDTEANNDCDS